jgi:N4-gp56 family major capsid protein
MLTNFGLLTTEQKTVWSMDLWKQARNLSFVNKFLGSDANAIVHHITELKRDEKGARAVITLIADLTGDGVAGDRMLEGNEEGMQTFDQVIRIDQLRNANRLEGRMADQKSIVTFRSNSRNLLAYWLADRIDQLAFLTLGGVSYTKKPNGATRVGSDLPYLEFAADVAAPSSNRRLRWDGTNKVLVASGASSAVIATDTPTWEMFVQLKAYCKDRYIRGTRREGGDELYHAFLCPQAMAKLKLDPTYMLNLRHSAPTVPTNQKLFSGGSVEIDGIVLHEFRHVPNTLGAASGSKYGGAGTVEGSQILFCGAQALAMADIGIAGVGREGVRLQQPARDLGRQDSWAS